MDLKQEINNYLIRNNKTVEFFAKETKINVDKLNKILEDKYKPNEKEYKNIEYILKGGLSTSKKIVRSLDLIFRLGSSIMALVTLLLCIKGDVSVKTLIVLLSIGLVCSSITILPKIEK